MTTKADVTDLVRVEREAMVDVLAGLSPTEWRTPSLCEGWTVQDVGAHLAWATAAPPWETGLGLLRSGLRINYFIHHSAKRWSGRGTDAILAQLRSNAEQNAKPLGMPPLAVITDAVLHQLDVRRPCDRPRQVPEAAFRATAGFVTGSGAKPPASLMLGNTLRKRTEGLRLQATDLEWSFGEGAEVLASRETVLLVLSGRRVTRDELDGPGSDTLLSRL